MNLLRTLFSAMFLVSSLSGCFLFDDQLGSAGPSDGDVGNPAALTLSAPPAVQAEATAALTSPVLGQPTATGGDGAYTFSNDSPPNGFPLGPTRVTWTVVDGAGDSESDVQSITISDTTPPTISVPPDLQIAATGTLTAVTIGMATASDLVDPNPAMVNDMPGGGFPVGTTPVTWTATDASTNSANAIQMITVVPESTGPLALVAPVDVVGEATAPTTILMLGAAMASGGQPPITITNDAPAGGLPVGPATVTWTATDAAMAIATDTQRVTVTDTTAPFLVAPPNVTADQGPGLGDTAVALGNPSVSDFADPSPSLSNDAPAGGFPVGDTIVTWTALDASGNAGNGTQTVTVNAFVADNCSDLITDFQNTIHPLMDSANPLLCNGCHTGASPLTTPNGFAFPNTPPTPADLATFRVVANIDSGGQSVILVKARGGAAHPGGDRFPAGASDPDFVTLSDFVARARACVPDPPQNGASVVLGTGYEQLHRVVSTLGSRTPTSSEVNLVAAASDQVAIDAALAAVMDGLMDEEAFYTRVREMYNDLILTDRDADDRGSVDGNFDLDAFDNRDYYDDNFSGGLRNDLREAANYGFARAPVELITYVIENDRPFTEVLTADYVMVNPYSAVIYGVDAGDPSFPFSSDQNPNNHDPEDFRPASTLQQSDGTLVPIAGVVGTHAFLARYPSTNTNVNRARSRYVFDYFLGVDIEALAARDGLDLDNVIGEVPTYEDPQCTVCHDVMDPLAGIFTKRDNGGEFDPGNRYVHTRTTNGVPRMVPAGYSLAPGDVLPSSDEDAPLVWLAQRMSSDDRFAEQTVRTVLEGLTGIEATDSATTAFVNETKNRFVASNFDFKALVRDVLLSDFFRAENLAPTEDPNAYADVGAGRLLTSEELDRKITSIVGGGYAWRGPNSNSGLLGRHYLLYGGIDSDDVVTRTVDPNSMIDGIQERIANQVACERVATDLYSGGTLFPFVDETTTPETGGEVAIRQNLHYLHRRLLGEDLALDSVEIDHTYQLFLDARALGESSIPSACRGGGGSTDTNGTVLPWMAVTSYLMADYRFVYE